MEALEHCPLCGTELSQTKYREIRAKIREQDERKASELAEARSAITRDLEQEFKAKLETLRRDAEKKAREGAEQQVRKAISEREQLAGKLKAAETREAEIRKQAQLEVEKRVHAAEEKANADAEGRVKRVVAERDLAAKKLKEAQEREAQIRKQVQEQTEKEQQKQLLEQRRILEADKTSALLKQQSEHNRDRESLQKKVKILESQLQKKTANELGDGGEIDVFEALRDTFQGDKITRIQKGQPGADILHEVLYKGEVCGRIIIDSKNRQAWQNTFVTKLRKDQVEAGAEHAIVAATVFPAGERGMCIESGVIVISPAWITYIVQLLRQAMIAAHVKGLSMKQRATKMSRLYALITSESYAAKFAEANKLTEDMLDVEVEEKSAHDNVWKKRGALLKRMNNVLRDVETDVAAIIEGADDIPELRPVTSAKGVALERTT